MPYIVPHALHDEYPFTLNEKETCLKKILKPSGKIFFKNLEFAKVSKYGPYCFAQT
jgi:hypothetical protein